MQGFQRGEWPNQFAGKAIYDPQAAGSSVCPVSPGGGSPGWGKARTGCSLGCTGLCMCPSTMLGAWPGGALEPWPAKWVLSQPPPGVHILDFKCERKEPRTAWYSFGWVAAGRPGEQQPGALQG